MKHTLSIILIMLLIGQMSCNSDRCIQGLQEEEVSSITLGTVIGVTNNIAADVYLIEGSSYNAEMIGPKDLLEAIDLRVIDQILTIQAESCLTNVGRVRINLTLPSINKVTVNGSGSIRTKANFNSKVTTLAMSVQGSGDIDVAQPTHNANLEVNGSGSLTLMTDGQSSVSAAINGSGNINLNGGMGDLTINNSGSGEFKGGTYNAEQATITLSGSGSAYVQVNQQLNATISGSGSIYYWGTPTINQNITGSGSLKPQ